MANQHVVPNNGQWQVKRENSTRATKNFNTQKEAISYARNIAINQQSELILGLSRSLATNNTLLAVA